MRKRLILLLALAAILGGILIAAIRYKESWYETRKPLQNVTVGLSWIHEAQFAGEYYADQNGLYKKQGLNVKLIPYDQHSDLVADLVSGKYDFAILQGDALLKARSEGKKVTGLFVTYRKSPTVFFSKKESGITKPSRFIGRKVGVAYSEKIPLLTMLEYAGVDASKVNIIDREYVYEPLLNGIYDVEAGWVTDQDTVEKIGMKNPNIIRAADYNANIFADIIAATEDTIKNKSDLVEKFMSATSEGWEQAARNPRESSLLALKYEPSADPEHLKFVLDASLPLIRPTKGSRIGSSSFIEWKRMYEILKKQGLFLKEFDVTEAYNTDFLH